MQLVRGLHVVSGSSWHDLLITRRCCSYAAPAERQARLSTLPGGSAVSPRSRCWCKLIGFAAGILLVRRLDQHEYALFTIANTMQGTINVLADIGISIGLVSIGGRVWQDRHRFGELVSTGLKLRRKLGAAAVLIVTPLLYLHARKERSFRLLRRDPDHAILGGLCVQLSLGVLDVVPRLRSDIRQIQKIDFTGSAVRLAILVGLAFIFLNAGVAAAGRFRNSFVAISHAAALRPRTSSTCRQRKMPMTARR